MMVYMRRLSHDGRNAQSRLRRPSETVMITFGLCQTLTLESGVRHWVWCGLHKNRVPAFSVFGL
jgi:hypothetical protein